MFIETPIAPAVASGNAIQTSSFARRLSRNVRNNEISTLGTIAELSGNEETDWLRTCVQRHLI